MLGIFAKTFGGQTPLEVLSAARRAGYSAVQYNMACSGLGSLPTAISVEAAEAVSVASLESGVVIAAVSATYNMIHPDLEKRAQGRRSFEVIAAMAPRMGTHLLTLCTGSRDPDDQWHYHPDNASAAAWEEMLGECSALLEVAERYDLLLGVEPEHANVVSSARRASELIAALGSERIRIIFDPANLCESLPLEEHRRVIDEAVTLLQGRIALVHAKDRRADGQVVAAGQGVIDFPYVLAALRRAGVAVPVITHGLAETEAEEAARYLQSVLAGSERAS